MVAKGSAQPHGEEYRIPDAVAAAFVDGTVALTLTLAATCFMVPHAHGIAWKLSLNVYSCCPEKVKWSVREVGPLGPFSVMVTATFTVAVPLVRVSTTTVAVPDDAAVKVRLVMDSDVTAVTGGGEVAADAGTMP